MALVSMTGFGRAMSSAGGAKIEVEISSVNRKQKDIRVSLPRDLAAMESRVKSRIEKSVSRGSVTAVINVGHSRHGGKSFVIDSEEASALIRQIRKTAGVLKMKDDLGAAALLALPVIREKELVDDREKIWSVLEKLLDNAVRDLVKDRKREGVVLEKDITGRWDKIEKILARIKKQAPRVAGKYRERLKKRLSEAGFESGENNVSLMREIAMFADRADISEEITRLDSHFAHGLKLINGRKACGRALDFLCQEMFREINTIGSKANDGVISRLVVLFKTDLECVREQVQNVE